MAKTTTLPLTQTLKSPAVVLNNASGASAITAGVPSNTVLFCTAGSEGSLLKSMVIASDDSAARYLSLWIDPGAAGTKYLIGTVAVPATAGYSATGVLLNVDVLSNGYLQGMVVDQSGRNILPLQAGTTVYVGMIAAITAGKTVFVTGSMEDF